MSRLFKKPEEGQTFKLSKLSQQRIWCEASHGSLSSSGLLNQILSSRS